MLHRLLDRITMHRLTIYYLSGLILVAVIAAVFGYLPYKPLDILITTTELVGGCLLANQIMADLLKANSSTESTLITALILTLLITPKFPISFAPIVIAGAFAIGSKYLATVVDHHVFNPVAAGLVALALLTDTSATWWVGTPILLPFVIIGGYLIVVKINREQMVEEFLGIFLLVIGIVSFAHSATLTAVLNTWYMSITHTALLFFTAIMLTEPTTSPGTKNKRRYFACLTALLYATPQMNFGIVFTPEMALAIANVFSYIISPQYRYVFKLKTRKLIARDTYEFEFETPNDLEYQPGQYMEWTLPHDNVDDRGIRRFFSLSSTTTESPAFAIKYFEPPSSYKKNLIAIPMQTEVFATNLMGDFTLPKNLNKPLVFIAGGIGIAPFRSMIKKIVEEKKQVNITLVYINRNDDEICYQDLWKEAKQYGVKTFFIITTIQGHLTTKILEQMITSYKNACYYLSGPQRLIYSVEQVLKDLGIAKKQIVTDFFPGY